MRLAEPGEGGGRVPPPLWLKLGAEAWNNNNRQHLKARPLQLASPTGMPGTVLWDYQMTVWPLLAAKLEMTGLSQTENINIHPIGLGGWRYSANMEGESKYLG